MRNDNSDVDSPVGAWRTGAVAGRTAGEDGVDVAQLLEALKNHWRFILACGVVLFSVVVGLTMMSRMQFVASGRLYLGEIDRQQASNGDLDISAGGQSDVSSEVEIIRSRAIVQRAVLASGHNVLLSAPGWQRPRYWQWRYSNRDLDLLKAVSDELVATDTALADDVRDAKGYRVVFRSDVEYDLFEEETLLGQGTLGATLAVDGLSVTLLPGTTRGPKSGAEYEMVVLPTDDVVSEAIDALEVEVPVAAAGTESVKVLNLYYGDGSPYEASNFLKYLMEVYLRERQAWKTEDASAAEAFVSKQLRGMRDSLDATQTKLADYRAENLEVVSENEAQAMAAQVGRFREQLVAARLEVSALQEVRRALRNPRAPVEAYMFGEANDAVLRGLAESLTTSRQELTELRSKFKEAAPDVRQQQAKVDGQLKMIRNYVQNRLARAAESKRELEKVIAELETRLKEVPGAELGLAQIDRESEVYSKMFSYLLERQQQTAIIKASTISKNRIIDAPRLPSYEDSPTMGLRLSSGLVGLLLGMFVVIMRTLASPALRSDSEVRTLSHVPVFASIPNMIRTRSLKGARQPPIFDVLAGGLDNFAFAEAFRTLRTNLYYSLNDGHGKVLLVTSPTPGDGKTTTALSLAAMLAADEKRVLVIDADIRKPSHHEMTGMPLRPGLRGLLAGECSREEITHPVHLSFGQFDSISFGADSRVELLTSGALNKFLIEARSHYHFIILDSASYPLVSDALALSNLADFVFSVVRLGKTGRSLTEEHLRGISAVSRNHALVVNNSVSALAYSSPYPAPVRSKPSEPERMSVVEAARQRLQ